MKEYARKIVLFPDGVCNNIQGKHVQSPMYLRNGLVRLGMSTITLTATS